MCGVSSEMKKTRRFEVFDDFHFAEFGIPYPKALYASALLPRKRTVAKEAVPPTDISVPFMQSKVNDDVSLEANKAIHFFTMLRRCMLYYFARSCTDRLFRDSNKWTLDGNDVVLTLRFCECCAKGNLAIASAYLKYFVLQEAETSKELPNKNDKLAGLWRLFRLKYTLAIHPCKKCVDRICELCIVHKDENGGIVVRYRMCKRCAMGHMEMTQLYNDNFVPQTEEGD